MHEVLIQMFILIGIGLGWSWLSPGGLHAELVRKVFTSAVYYLFLPALVFTVISTSPLGLHTLKISLSAASGVIAAIAAALLLCRFCTIDKRNAGALVIAASFPNATYLGLPLLDKTLGPWSKSIAMQYDLFACTPLVFTLGIFLASRFGNQQSAGILHTLVRVPPLWAALLAVLFNLNQWSAPVWIHGALDMMGKAVVPLMLIAIGMALRPGFKEWRQLPSVLPAIVIQLALMPLVVWLVASNLGLGDEMLVAVVLEGALPSMVLGIVLCDRYQLNTGLFAAALSITTLLSIFTLPAWYAWLAA
jgi:predicted permease